MSTVSHAIYHLAARCGAHYERESVQESCVRFKGGEVTFQEDQEARQVVVYFQQEGWTDRSARKKVVDMLCDSLLSLRVPALLHVKGEESSLIPVGEKASIAVAVLETFPYVLESGQYILKSGWNETPMELLPNPENGKVRMVEVAQAGNDYVRRAVRFEAASYEEWQIERAHWEREKREVVDACLAAGGRFREERHDAFPVFGKIVFAGGNRYAVRTVEDVKRYQRVHEEWLGTIQEAKEEIETVLRRLSPSFQWDQWSTLFGQKFHCSMEGEYGQVTVRLLSNHRQWCLSAEEAVESFYRHLEQWETFQKHVGTLSSFEEATEGWCITYDEDNQNSWHLTTNPHLPLWSLETSDPLEAANHLALYATKRREVANLEKTVDRWFNQHAISYTRLPEGEYVFDLHAHHRYEFSITMEEPDAYGFGFPYEEIQPFSCIKELEKAVLRWLNDLYTKERLRMLL